MKHLSIIIPVFNEEETITEVVTAVDQVTLPGWKKEIIVIDDGSLDGTQKKVSQLKRTIPVKLIVHPTNKGKGQAVQSGMKQASGEYILIQDADLEYSPSDIPRLLKPVEEGMSQVVYGTRLKRRPNLTRDERTLRFFFHYVGNRSLSFLLSLLYGHSLTDIETGYKLFPKDAVNNMKLISKGFEFEPEITIKLLKSGFSIQEVPIRTNPRGYDKGKKLQTIPDGIKALRMILQHI